MTADSAPGGLREQHKIRTRAAIRAAAMDLFARNGYAATTVAEIARAAEVSHTTFFRYFQSKEQVIIADDMEEKRHEALEAIEPGLDRFTLIRRLLSALLEVGKNDPWASNTERLDLIMNEPILRMAYQFETDRALTEATDYIADYLGVARDDFALHVFVTAIAGTIVHLANRSHGFSNEMFEEIMEAIDLLEAGLPVPDDGTSARTIAQPARACHI